jgi:hypothetical protein
MQCSPFCLGCVLDVSPLLPVQRIPNSLFIVLLQLRLSENEFRIHPHFVRVFVCNVVLTSSQHAAARESIVMQTALPALA